MNNVVKILKWVAKRGVILSGGLLLLVSILSLLPADELPPFPGTDKTHHFVAYAAVMFPITLAHPRYWWRVGLFVIIYSGLIELIQPHVNRYGEWLDLAANSGGVLVGVLVACVARRRL